METSKYNVVIFRKNNLLTFLSMGAAIFFAIAFKNKYDEVERLKDQIKELTPTKGE